MPTKPRPIWIAASDGIGHARYRRSDSRTLCSAPAINERYGWPVIAQCRLCESAIARARVKVPA